MSRDKDNKDKFIRSFQARRILRLAGFITDAENDKILSRLTKFQDKHQITVTEDELNNVTDRKPNNND